MKGRGNPQITSSDGLMIGIGVHWSHKAADVCIVWYAVQCWCWQKDL